MKVAMITGAGRNIGQHLAERFASEGYAVVVNARSADSIERVAAGIRERGGKAIAVPADVRVPDQVDEMFRLAKAEFGPVDVLINGAVIRVQVPIAEMTLEQWRLPIDVVLDGAFNCSKAALPDMIERGWGRIIGLGGVSGQTGAPNRVGVVASKSGLMGFTKALALEVATTGVTVNVVSPGMIATERGDHTAVGSKETVERHYSERQKQIPVGRMGELNEVSGACLYLASGDAAYVTGQTLSVSGGLVT